MKYHLIKTILISFSFVAATVSFGKSVHAVEIQVQRPAAISLPSDVKQIFIYPKLFKSKDDQLKMKARVLLYLKKEINALGRFKVTLGAPRGYDPNKETVAIVQGEILSGMKSVNGQLTDKGDCSITSAIGANGEDKFTGITKSRRGLTCTRTDDYSEIPAINVSSISLKSIGKLFGQDLPDVKAPDIQQPVDQVIRKHRFTNHSIFVQAQFSVTLQGKIRETVLVKTESASFNRQVVDPMSYRNIRESGDQFSGAVWPLLLISPVVSNDNFDVGVVFDSIPDRSSRYFNRVVPLPKEDKRKVISQLLKRVIEPFIYSISPYKVSVQTEIADSAPEIVELLQEKKFMQAKILLREIETPSHEDLYNTGLAYEATALTLADLEDAKRYYVKAIKSKPATELYAQGIGRIEFQLKSYKKLKAQTN